jgi:diguanylate cyclase (GGDEF)-like protein/PAS domain S-box-containing protein
LFTLPVSTDFNLGTRRAAMVQMITAAALVGVSIILLGSLVGGATPAITLILVSALWLLFLLAFILVRAGRVTQAAILILGASFVFLTFIIASLGTVRSPTTAIFLFLVVMATAVFGKKGAAVSILLSSLIVLGLIAAENAGMLPLPNNAANITYWVLYCILLIMTGGLTYNINQLSINTLERLNIMDNELRRIEIELRKQAMVIEQSPASIVITDLEGNIEYINPRFTLLTGYSLDEALGQNMRILNSGHTPQETYNDLWSTIRSGREWHGEFINRRKNGSEFVEAASIAPITGLDGKVTHYLAEKEDITERKQTEMNLRVRLELVEYSTTHNIEEILVKALDAVCDLTRSPIGFFHYVEPDQVTLSKQAWSTRTTQEFCKADGRNLHNSIDKAGVWVECVRTRKAVVHNDYASLPDRKGLPEGHPAVVRELVVPTLRSGLVVDILGVGNKPSDYTDIDVDSVTLIADVLWEITLRKRAEVALQEANEMLKGQLAENELLQEELREQALCDPMTGLFNRRDLGEMLDMEAARARRDGLPVSIIMIDLDHFKQVNDTYGHRAGDVVLKQIAGLLKDHTRVSDIACRYGGEEFLLVLPGAGAAEARARAEELRELCAQARIQFGKDTLSVTLSFGVASFPEHGADMEAIVNKADEAMYRSKAAGRNRVTVWSGEPV